MSDPSLKRLLEQHGLRASKALGQNFLTDPMVARRIVEGAGIGPGDRVVEIGPGLGSLTLPLVEAVGEVTVIEKDRGLVPILEERLQGRKIHVVEGDALRVDMTRMAEAMGGKLRVVANLPYSISTPILFHLLAHRAAIRDMTLMFQREVADRIVAAPGGGDYGVLSVFCQLWMRCTRLFTVAPGSFYPVPKVVSAVVRLEVRNAPLADVGDEAVFTRLVKGAFGQRRKTLRNALRGAGMMEVDAWCARLGMDPLRRGETLSVEEFCQLARVAAEEGIKIADTE